MTGIAMNPRTGVDWRTGLMSIPRIRNGTPSCGISRRARMNTCSTRASTLAGRAQPLQTAARDEGQDGRAEGADESTEREEDEAGAEHPPVTDDVADRAGDEDERDEGHVVGVQDPLDIGHRRAETAGDRRHRQVEHVIAHVGECRPKHCRNERGAGGPRYHRPCR